MKAWLASKEKCFSDLWRQWKKLHTLLMPEERIYNKTMIMADITFLPFLLRCARRMRRSVQIIVIVKLLPSLSLSSGYHKHGRRSCTGGCGGGRGRCSSQVRQEVVELCTEMMGAGKVSWVEGISETSASGFTHDHKLLTSSGSWVVTAWAGNVPPGMLHRKKLPRAHHQGSRPKRVPCRRTNCE